MLKIVTVIGARPQFVKAAAFNYVLRRQTDLEEVVVHTGQHYDANLSEIFFSELGLTKPKYNLNVGSGSHGQQTAQMLNRIEELLIVEQPQCVLVYGDTNSTLAGALAAVKLHIPVVHVEAGLRSYNHYQPEEINRVLTDRISDLLFVPSQESAQNLLQEGVTADKIHVVGDIMYDVAIMFRPQAENSSILNQLEINNKPYILATIHRAENTDHPEVLKKICDEFNKLSKTYDIVLPLHPRAKESLSKYKLTLNEKIKCIDPVGFLHMIKLVSHAKVVVTDSGGLQKEAFYHKIPCITLRDVTEWVELTQNGWNVVLPPDQLAELTPYVADMIDLNKEWINPYGDGDTAEKIIDVIKARYA